jgi:histidyl-tRNA synthetase
MTKDAYNFTLASGFNEFLPEFYRLELHLLGKMREVFESYGFTPISTPVVERLEVLQAKDNQGDNIIYSVTPILSTNTEEEKTESRGLKFDHTVPLGAYVARNLNNLTFPFCRYQMDSVFRGERPKKYRYRQFTQCDIDVIGRGELSPLYDAVMIAITSDLFKKLNFGDFQIRINNRKILSAFFNEIGVPDAQIRSFIKVIDELEKNSKANILGKLENLGLDSEELREKVLAFCTIKGQSLEAFKEMRDFLGGGSEPSPLSLGINELEELYQNALNLGVSEKHLVVDVGVARGLGYYTGSVYETTLLAYPQIGSVCSGGRYDELVGTFCSEKMPGVGISIGWTRLFNILIDLGELHPLSSSPAEVLILKLDSSLNSKYLSVGENLRNKGLKVLNFFEDKPVGKQIKLAEKLGIPVGVFIGPEEEKNNLARIKFFASREQVDVSQDEIAPTIISSLKSDNSIY